MKRVLSLFAAVAMTVVMSASVAEAQSPIRFGIAGGLSMPSGDLEDGLDNGFHGQFMLGFGMMALPVKLRADLSYHSFGGKDDVLGSDSDFRVISGALNGIVGMGGIGVKPYLTAGVGMYNQKLDIGVDSDSETDFGLNGGIGLEFSLTGMSTFLEVRYVKVFVGEDADGESFNSAFIPITFGILF